MLLSALRRGATRNSSNNRRRRTQRGVPRLHEEEIAKGTARRRDPSRTKIKCTTSATLSTLTRRRQKIKLAAGRPVEPFWRIYKQHLDPPWIFNKSWHRCALVPFMKDFAKETSIQREKKDDDLTRTSLSDILPHTYVQVVQRRGAGRDARHPINPSELWYV